MTDQPQHTDETPTEAQHTAPVPQAPQFTEAPYSGNVRARIAGYDWQLTIRASDSKTFLDKINGLMVWLNNNADRAVNVETPHAPTVSAPAPVVPSANVAAPQTSIVNTFQIVKMQVAPRADGKVDLKFFEAGHQYPDISTSKTAADAVNLLKATGKWEPFHFAQAAEFNVNFVLTWKNSAKLNSKGNPYKDIVTISAA